MNDAAIKQISGGNRMILCTDVIAHDEELKKVPGYNSEGLIAEKCKSTAL